MLGVLIFDTLPGLFIGIALSILLLLSRVSRPRIAKLGEVPGGDGQYADVERHPENTEPDGVRVLRIEGGLFFANADSVRAQVRRHAAETGVHAIVLDAEAMPFIDVTAAGMLQELDEDLARRHVRLLIARDVGLVRDVLRTAEDDPSLRHVYPSVQAAVDAASDGG
jgi:SulP family sulfate permease